MPGLHSRRSILEEVRPSTAHSACAYVMLTVSIYLSAADDVVIEGGALMAFLIPFFKSIYKV